MKKIAAFVISEIKWTVNIFLFSLYVIAGPGEVYVSFHFKMLLLPERFIVVINEKPYTIKYH